MMEGEDGEIFRVNFGVRFGPALAAAAGLLVVLYVAIPGMREELRYAALVAGAGAVSYGSYHVGGAIQRRVRQVRSERTMALLERLNDESSVRLRVFIARRLAQAEARMARGYATGREERGSKRERGRSGAKPRERVTAWDEISWPARGLYQEIVRRKKLLRAVTRLLGLYEEVSIAVQTGEIDELTAHRALRASMSFHFRHLKPYVEQARLASGEFGLYAEAEKLVTSWEQGRKLSTGAALRT